MKATIKIEKEVELKTLVVEAYVGDRWDSSTINGEEDTNGNIPCRKGDSWCPIIDIDSGMITNWTKGVTAEVHYKIVDSGSYYLQDEDGNNVLSIEEDYVPKIMCPGGDGWGDYIIMDIDENGQIDNWRPTLSGFEGEDDE